MINYLTLLALGLLTTSAFAGDVYVNGYYRKDGTYVAPHVRSAPNGTVTDNYSYRAGAPRASIPLVPYRLPPPPSTRASPVQYTRCVDGWVSSSSGSGTCSSHGGVAGRGQRYAGAAGHRARTIAVSTPSSPLSYVYVGAARPDPSDSSYAYRLLESGDYAVFRDGRRTGTAAQGTAAWDSIKDVLSRRSPLTRTQAQTAVKTIRSLSLAEDEKAKRITSVIARYSGLELQSLTPEDVRQQLLLLNL